MSGRKKEPKEEHLNLTYVPAQEVAIGDRTDGRPCGRGGENVPLVSTGEPERKPDGDNTNPVLDENSGYFDKVTFRVPVFKWRQHITFFAVEFIATLLFCSLIFIAQGDLSSRTGKFTTTPTSPTNADYFQMSTVKAVAGFICTFLSWHMGKATFNPAVTLLSAALSLQPWLPSIIRVAIQMATSLLAYTLVYGFVYPVDPSLGPGIVNLADHAPYYHFLWEFFATTILAWISVWVLFVDRAFGEGASMALAKHGKINDKAKVSKGGEGTHEDNSAPLGVTGIPAGYQQTTFGGVSDLKAAFLLSSALWVLSYTGMIATGGDSVLNFLLWFPRVINQNRQNGDFAIPLPVQGGIYFGAPLLGAVLTLLGLFGVLWFTRKCNFFKFEWESVPYGDYPMST